MTPVEKLVEFLGNFLEYCYNNIETIYGIGHNNEHEPITLPVNVNCNCIAVYSCMTAANFNTPYWGGGQWKLLYTYDLNYIDGVTSYNNFVYIGRYDKSKWDLIIPWSGGVPNPDVGESDVLNFIEQNGNMYFYNTQPTEKVLTSFFINPSQETVISLYDETSGAGALYSKCAGYEYTRQAQYVNFTFKTNDIRIDTTEPYVICTHEPPTIPMSYHEARLKDACLITRINDSDVINNYITNNDADHNYTYTYETETGDEVTVYYGDNYVIYKCDDDTQITYDDNYNIINKIKNDTGLPVSNPTYKDRKYGPDPEFDEDDIDNHVMGAGTNISDFAMLWLLTKSQLNDLHGAFNNCPAGFDPLNSFISVMGLGIDVTKILTDIQYITPINIRLSSDTTWQTQVEGHIVSGETVVSAFYSDVFRIQRKYDNFLDYSPYAVHELFIPMCGWVTLPDIAVDRDMKVCYIPDIENCKIRAVVLVASNSPNDNGAMTPIAEKDGIMGCEVPISNIGHSLFVGDAIVNGANVAGEIATMAIGAGFTKTNAKGTTFKPYEGFTLGGAGTLPSAIGNAFVSGNLNRTHFMTGNSCRTGFSDGEYITVKSTYSLPDIPENYAHTVGLMCNKTGQLSEFEGFTVCDNPHINFSALEAEKEEIKRLLEEGVIL